MELNRENYYQTHMLSVSTVKLFAINSAHALADYRGEESWLGDHNLACALGTAFHQNARRCYDFY